MIESDSRILDVGCGPASIAVGLARWAHSGHVTGIEVTDEILATAAATVAEAGAANVTLANESVYELPYDDGSFDVVYAHQVCQHLSDPVAAISEMARAVRPDGRVAVRDSDYSTMIFQVSAACAAAARYEMAIIRGTLPARGRMASRRRRACR
ncbi:class I SAM-dependent methyltransferase [Candidatus Poriferisodalis sp.]|uniref:class I SAM-dependent methyltransferase n=1 Tax=Candidatus Poriferisodalis sp. TaxID=3101277 RepID=UPI003B012E76